MNLSPAALAVQFILVAVFTVITVGAGFYSYSLWTISQVITQRSPQSLAKIVDTSPQLVSQTRPSVEVEATVTAEQSNLLTAPLTGDDCVAYRYRVEKRGVIGWTTVDKGGDSTEFTITEGADTAYITAPIETIQLPLQQEPIEIESVPAASEIQFTDGETTPDEALKTDAYRLYESQLTPGTAVYVVGHLHHTDVNNEQTVIKTTDGDPDDKRGLPSQPARPHDGQIFRVTDLDTTTNRGWAYVFAAVATVGAITTLTLVVLLISTIV